MESSNRLQLSSITTCQLVNKPLPIMSWLLVLYIVIAYTVRYLVLYSNWQNSGYNNYFSI